MGNVVLKSKCNCEQLNTNSIIMLHKTHVIISTNNNKTKCYVLNFDKSNKDVIHKIFEKYLGQDKKVTIYRAGNKILYATDCDVDNKYDIKHDNVQNDNGSDNKIIKLDKFNKLRISNTI